MVPDAFAYLDDIVVVTDSFDEHLKVLLEVFRRLRATNLEHNKEKCFFTHRELKYLGHVVDERGLHPDPQKIEAIDTLRPPANVCELRPFLGLVARYRCFVKDVSSTMAPLTCMLK